MTKLDMRTGSTAVMILRLLAEKPMYGYQIVKELQTRSEGYFEVEQGTLYPALHRLEKDGLVSSQWEVVEDGPSRKYYTITEAGRIELEKSAQQWTDFSRNLLKLLGGLAQ
ncbi:MAG: PadR family transcriptional regulator [Anaerolineae bacterium]